MIWLNQHLHALQVALKRLRQQPIATLFSALVMALAASIPAGGYTVLTHIAELAGRANPQPHVTIFMTPSATEAEVASVAEKLKSDGRLESVRFVPKAEAMEQMSAAGIGEVARSLGHNPLPDAFIVASKNQDPTALQALKTDFSGWPKVEKVQLDEEWAKRLDALLAFGKRVLNLLSIFLGAALIAVVANTIRLQILNQREEIEVSSLIGASNSFVRRPFLYFGTLQGLLGGVLAILLVAAALYGLNASLADLGQLYGLKMQLLRPPWIPALMLVLGLVALSWLGALLAVSLYLRTAGK